MSLRHALLGLLAEGPASGYDLARRFQEGLNSVWPAQHPQIYSELEKKTIFLKEGLLKALEKKGIPVIINQSGSMISVFFTDRPVKDFASASTGNTETFRKFFHFLLDQGIYLPPSAFESWFLNNALSTRDLEETIDAASGWADS